MININLILLPNTNTHTHTLFVSVHVKHCVASYLAKVRDAVAVAATTNHRFIIILIVRFRAKAIYL